MKNIEDVVDIILKENKDVEGIIEFKYTSKKEVCSKFHHGFGTNIRNKFKLWDKTKNVELKEFFNKNEIHHADDMSGLIMTSLWCRLNDIEFNLEAEVVPYVKYWNKDVR